MKVEIPRARLLFLDDDLRREEVGTARFFVGDQLVDLFLVVAVGLADFGDVLGKRAKRHRPGRAIMNLVRGGGSRYCESGNKSGDRGNRQPWRRFGKAHRASLVQPTHAKALARSSSNFPPGSRSF